MSAIFGTKADAATPGATSGGGSPASGGSVPSAAPAAPTASVDVAPILDKAVAAKKEKLEWRTSIVDLMKALDIDFQPDGAQGTRQGAALHRRHQ